MAKKFGNTERAFLAQFATGEKFVFQGKKYTIIKSGKPGCRSGEPKTDIFVKTCDDDNNEFDLKISVKQSNADFLENKMTAERAEQIFGDNWQSIIKNILLSIKPQFESRPLIFKKAGLHTDAGSIALGWKFEFVNKSNGDLSGEVTLTKEQALEVYSGRKLTDDKRNSKVKGEIINNSGIADYIIAADAPFATLQETINNLRTVEEYSVTHPKIYFACKALNYRTFKKKYDGNRPLAVYVDWSVNDGLLSARFCFNTPLEQRGDAIAEKLKKALATIGAETTDDLTDDKIDKNLKILI